MPNHLIAYSDDGLEFDAFVARPAGPIGPVGEGPRPVVLVCHAWGGRDGFAEARAIDLAELGYVGVAIDLYGVGKRGTDPASSQALMSGLVSEPALLRRRLGKAYEVARTLDGVDPTRIGVIGYCFGGLCAILCARMGLDLRAAVSFHGLLKIGEPLDGPILAKLLVLHGQDDPLVPPTDLAAFALEMKRIDADWQLHAYPKVVHGFTNPNANNPSFGTVYDADAAARAWIEMSRFLADCLV